MGCCSGTPSTDKKPTDHSFHRIANKMIEGMESKMKIKVEKKMKALGGLHKIGNALIL